MARAAEFQPILVCSQRLVRHRGVDALPLVRLVPIARDAVELGAVNFLSKPFNVIEFARAVRRALDGPATRGNSTTDRDSSFDDHVGRHAPTIDD